MNSLLRWFIDATKPFVWRLAEAYDMRVDRPLHAYGVNALHIEGSQEAARHRIPKSVIFNTGSGEIFVGKNTVFGQEVAVLTGKHMNAAEAKAKGLPLHHVPQGLDIRIGQDCYIGSRAVLIGPVTIGDHAVICAGSVVTQDVPAGAFVAGSPARVYQILEGFEEPAA